MTKRIVAAETLSGIIGDYFETGLEGVCWIFLADWYNKPADGKTIWDYTFFLEKGDWLKVITENGTILFEGIINPDRKTGIPNGPRRQPSALGMWIHWTQRGWKPNAWAELFCRGYVAKLTRKELAEYTEKVSTAIKKNDADTFNALNANWATNHPNKPPFRAEFRAGKNHGKNE